MKMANEQRLIDYEQAKRATYEEVFWSESEQAVVRNFLAKLPKVDAVEVVHGRWIFKHNPITDPKRYFIRIVCSECDLHTGQVSNYCPNCGAKMDGGNENVNLR